jgi:hypothetical protein
MPFRTVIALALAAFFCLAAPVRAQFDGKPAPAIREVSPGVFELGQIRIDRQARTVSFPATVNKIGAKDLLEYLLVTKDGPTHESLLLTAVEPRDVHAAMLLLGAKGSGVAGRAGDSAGGKIDAEFLKRAPKLTGDSIRIDARWKAADGTGEESPIEDWVLNLETDKAMTRGPWLYNGSQFFEGGFRAQAEGCLGALVTYPPALINNPRQGNDQDDVWAVNTRIVPPVDTPITLVITLEAPAK